MTMKKYNVICLYEMTIFVFNNPFIEVCVQMMTSEGSTFM